MIYTFTPVEMGIYVNTGMKSINQIKAELNCDIICNLNLFNGNWTGAAYTKSNGKVVGSDGYNYSGLGFNRYDKVMTRNWSACDTHENFFGCCDFMKNGKVLIDQLPSFTNGWRRRTIIGMTKDGKIGIYANENLEVYTTMKNNLVNGGFVEAVILDGGGSTQLICPNGVVVSSDYSPRPVHTLFWAKLKKEPISTQPSSGTKVCPYKEPTGYIQCGSSGEGAKWVQWMLNKYGYGLDVDGIFGGKSSSALVHFQISQKLVADGICGEATRAKLRQG